MNEPQQQHMTDEYALQYTLETLQDLDEHCTNDDQRAELSEVISVVRSILDSYENCSFGLLQVGEEDVEA